MNQEDQLLLKNSRSYTYLFGVSNGNLLLMPVCFDAWAAWLPYDHYRA